MIGEVFLERKNRSYGDWEAVGVYQLFNGEHRLLPVTTLIPGRGYDGESTIGYIKNACVAGCGRPVGIKDVSTVLATELKERFYDDEIDRDYDIYVVDYDYVHDRSDKLYDQAGYVDDGEWEWHERIGMPFEAYSRGEVDKKDKEHMHWRRWCDPNSTTGISRKIINASKFVGNDLLPYVRFPATQDEYRYVIVIRY